MVNLLRVCLVQRMREILMEAKGKGGEEREIFFN